MSWWSGIGTGSEAPAGRRGPAFTHKYTTKPGLKTRFPPFAPPRAFVLLRLASLVGLLCGKIGA